MTETTRRDIAADTDPARISRLPPSVSEAARTALAAAAARPRTPYPENLDPAAWESVITSLEAMWLEMIRPLADLPGVTDHTEYVNGVPVYVCTPAGAADDCAYMDIHGGGFIVLGGEACRLMARMTALRLGVCTYSVDYRMPPHHPFPAALDDCVAVYDELVARYGADRLVAGGTSAGGNLAAALALRVRDEGKPLPAGLVLLTPALDLTESGDTFLTNRDIDVALPSPAPWLMRLYAGEADLSHPYLSPLFGDFEAGFPPTLLQSGTRDLLLSNVVRMHRALRKAGIPVELHIFEAMPHGGFGGTPEDMEISAEVRAFAHSRLGISAS